MKLKDVVNYSYVGLRHRQGRFWLTIIGIIVGIGSVVALLTLGTAFSAEVDRQLGSLSGNTIYVIPVAESASAFNALSPSSGKLTDKDIERLGRIPELNAITRLSERRATLEYKGKEISATVSGYEPGVFEQIATLDVAEGRGLLDSDRRVVQLGGVAAEEMFGKENPVRVNSYILINSQKYRVISILSKTGGGFGTDLDNGVFVHFQDSYDIFGDDLRRGEMDAIAASFDEGTDLGLLVDKIKMELDASHKVKPDERDYTVMDPKTIQESIGGVLALVTLFLGAIAGISLVVGGLSIASSMFTSVIERTQEIGVLKSIGATDSDIMKIFLFEAGALGAIGGIAGTLLALVAVFIAGLFGFPVALNIPIALFGIAFAFTVGMVSGYFPAKQAADMSPVDALRFDL